MSMSKQEMVAAKRECNSNWEILSMAIQSGLEFPDAVWRVSQALKLDAEDAAQMELDYDEIC